MVKTIFNKNDVIYMSRSKRNNKSNQPVVPTNFATVVPDGTGNRGSFPYRVYYGLFDDNDGEIWNSKLYRHPESYPLLWSTEFATSSIDTFSEMNWMPSEHSNSTFNYKQVVYISFINGTPAQVYRAVNSQAQGLFTIPDRPITINNSSLYPDNDTIKYYKLQSSGVTIMNNIRTAIQNITTIMYGDVYLLLGWTRPTTDGELLSLLRNMGFSVNNTIITVNV